MLKSMILIVVRRRRKRHVILLFHRFCWNTTESASIEDTLTSDRSRGKEILGNHLRIGDRFDSERLGIMYIGCALISKGDIVLYKQGERFR